VVVNVFFYNSGWVFNHFVEGSQIQTYSRKFYHKSIDTFCFTALTSLLHKNRGVTEKLLRAAQDAWELYATLRSVREPFNCSTSNTMPASYVTALEIIKPKKHQRLVDPLLQSGVITCSN